MSDSIFDKIIAGEIPCHKVYEDENSLAFLDIQPIAQGHTLVIPKIAGETVNDFSEEVLGNLMIAVKKTMVLLQQKLNPAGFNVGWNHKTAGGQVVPYLHVHILPRYEGDEGGSMHSIVSDPGEMSVEEVAELFK